MAAPRKTPTLQGSVNLIAREVQLSAHPDRVVSMICLVAMQFGKTFDDVKERIDMTLRDHPEVL